MNSQKKLFHLVIFIFLAADSFSQVSSSNNTKTYKIDSLINFRDYLEVKKKNMNKQIDSIEETIDNYEMMCDTLNNKISLISDNKKLLEKEKELKKMLDSNNVYLLYESGLFSEKELKDSIIKVQNILFVSKRNLINERNQLEIKYDSAKRIYCAQLEKNLRIHKDSTNSKLFKDPFSLSEEEYMKHCLLVYKINNSYIKAYREAHSFDRFLELNTKKIFTCFDSLVKAEKKYQSLNLGALTIAQQKYLKEKFAKIKTEYKNEVKTILQSAVVLNNSFDKIFSEIVNLINNDIPLSKIIPQINDKLIKSAEDGNLKNIYVIEEYLSKFKICQ